MQKVEELFRRDDSVGALAGLANLLRANPTNRVAMERLMGMVLVIVATQMGLEGIAAFFGLAR